MARRSWTIRPEGERDARAVIELLAVIAREGRYVATEWPFDIDERVRVLRDALLTRRAVGWVAEFDRTIVGHLGLYELHRDDPELGMMVAPEHRGRGIGRALLEYAVSWATANEKPAISLRVFPDNERALALYRALGFVEAERQYGVIPRRNGAALDVLLMRREIERR